MTGAFVLPGADDEIRTRDPHLGKVMLYQLSHVRRSCRYCTRSAQRTGNCFPPGVRPDTRRAHGEGPGHVTGAFVPAGADDEIRTRDPHLGKVMLYQLSHVRRSC
ncbi:hypothetical protein SBRY_30766 [Actinacidiphila bryophytorum]|uniref:Uncharacterized protein n=1 Tax=Actinacidiphila bryophytorum TaxID=1436133 RepID=A0A9W4MA68_9ACTN|nr:hypothetical protein SBRY_30766 [Actinacidiphila bryophytorum]